GLSTRGSISLGCALVAGRKRVPSPAAGITALRTFTMAIPPISLIRRRFYSPPGRSSPAGRTTGASGPRLVHHGLGRFLRRWVAPPETPCEARGYRAVPGDRRPSKRKSRPERERIEYATDALGWLREQLEPPPQQPPADPRPQPPGPPAPEPPRQAMAELDPHPPESVPPGPPAPPPARPPRPAPRPAPPAPPPPAAKAPAPPPAAKPPSPKRPRKPAAAGKGG